jgi:hypothetical protein
VAGLLLLSLSKGKRGDYILPLLPSLALLAGCFWPSAYSPEEKGRHWLGRVAAAGQAAMLALVTGCLLSLAILAPLSDWWKERVMGPFFSRGPALLSSLVGAFGQSLPVGSAVTVAVALAAWLWLKAAFRRPAVGGPRRRHLTWAAFGFTVGVVLAGQWFYRQTVLPVLEKRFGSRSAAVEIDRVVPQGQTVTVFSACPYELLFYLDRPTQALPSNYADTVAQGAGGAAPFYCLLPLQEYLGLPADLREQMPLLYQTPPEARQQLVLAANNPARAQTGPSARPATRSVDPSGDAAGGQPTGRQ